jgi:hypothetical protein
MTTKQVETIYLIKINEIEMSDDFSQKDKEIMKQFYRRKIAQKNSKK